MIPRPAATLVIVRPGSGGLEVLMLERPARGFFGGLWVFPGGGVEQIDSSPLARSAVAGDHADLRWRAAALRETVEEVGLALTAPPTDEPLVATGTAVYESVIAGAGRLDGDALRLLSQWVTPAGAPTRFDARFYLTRLDRDPRLVPERSEVLDVAWVRPGRALERCRDGTWGLVTPTIHHLEWLAGHDDVDAAWEAASNATGERVEPVVEADGSEVKVTLPASARLP